MSRFELGQFLIGLGCKVDLTKFRWTLLQRWEQGSQCSELSTGRRGMTLQLLQISSWRSVYGSEMGDPMLPQLPGGFNQTILMTVIAQVKKPAFKKLWRPVQTFQVTPTGQGRVTCWVGRILDATWSHHCHLHCQNESDVHGKPQSRCTGMKENKASEPRPNHEDVAVSGAKRKGVGQGVKLKQGAHRGERRKSECFSSSLGQ